MVVKKVEYEPIVRIEHRFEEDFRVIERYMERHNWYRVTSLFGRRDGNYLEYSKKFIDVDVMQNEIQDIKDAFNR